MVKRTLILAILCIVLKVDAQQNYPIGSGLIKANLSLSQGFMLNYPSQNLYLNGYLEYFVDKKFSIRGDGYYYIDSRQNNPIYKRNYLLQFGAVYHKLIKISDFQIGFQPGFSITEPSTSGFFPNGSKLSLMPNLNLMAAYTLFFSKYCNFNIGVNYVFSKYRGAKNGSLNFDELMISGGLGFHINSK